MNIENENNINQWARDRKKILNDLKGYISEDRYIHTLGVEETAVKMARIFGIDENKASLAALLHDCAKELGQDEIMKMARQDGWPITKWDEQRPGELLHAPASAFLADKEFSIKDKDVLQAIKYHTLGNNHMSQLDMVIFVADMIEPNRNFPGVEKLRKIAFSDLIKAVLACLEHTLSYLHNKKIEVHPQTNETYLSLQRYKSK